MKIFLDREKSVKRVFRAQWTSATPPTTIYSPILRLSNLRSNGNFLKFSDFSQNSRFYCRFFMLPRSGCAHLSHPGCFRGPWRNFLNKKKLILAHTLALRGAMKSFRKDLMFWIEDHKNLQVYARIFQNDFFFMKIFLDREKSVKRVFRAQWTSATPPTTIYSPILRLSNLRSNGNFLKFSDFSQNSRFYCRFFMLPRSGCAHLSHPGCFRGPWRNFLNKKKLILAHTLALRGAMKSFRKDLMFWIEDHKNLQVYARIFQNDFFFMKIFLDREKSVKRVFRAQWTSATPPTTIYSPILRLSNLRSNGNFLKFSDFSQNSRFYCRFFMLPRSGCAHLSHPGCFRGPWRNFLNKKKLILAHTLALRGAMKSFRKDLMFWIEDHKNLQVYARIFQNDFFFMKIFLDREKSVKRVFRAQWTSATPPTTIYSPILRLSNLRSNGNFLKFSDFSQNSRFYCRFFMLPRSGCAHLSHPGCFRGPWRNFLNKKKLILAHTLALRGAMKSFRKDLMFWIEDHKNLQVYARIFQNDFFFMKIFLDREKSVKRVFRAQWTSATPPTTIYSPILRLSNLRSNGNFLKFSDFSQNSRFYCRFFMLPRSGCAHLSHPGCFQGAMEKLFEQKKINFGSHVGSQS